MTGQPTFDCNCDVHPSLAGAPCWALGNVRLYHGDCLKIAPTLSAIDAVITDPPYGISYVHGGGGGMRTKAAGLRGNHAIIGDSQPFDPSPWIGFGNVLMWGADHYYRRLPDSGRMLAWNKLGTLEPWDSFCDVEFAWHSGEGAARIFSMMWKGLACDKRGEANGLRIHPTQKPIRLMAWCLEQAGVPEGATVLDPYMGSGTTGIACIRTGRGFVGIEKDPVYFPMALERIKREMAQMLLLPSPNARTEPQPEKL